MENDGLWNPKPNKFTRQLPFNFGGGRRCAIDPAVEKDLGQMGLGLSFLGREYLLRTIHTRCLVSHLLLQMLL